MIEFRNVSASYDGELAVLHDVSFTVNDGDFVAFVGTNGAGKSTTMRLANGLLKPTSGEVLVDGVPTTQLKTSELARKMGFLFQNPDRQICCNTVREELLFGFKALGEVTPEDEARVDAIIERFGFDGSAEPFLLNRGTRQLLALASIIVLAPPTIILDEPTTGLDFRECVKVMDIVRELNESGTTVIMVCHDMEVVGDFADRVIAMTQGQVVADGATFDALRDGEVLKRAHILPPQVTEIAMILGQNVPNCPQAVAQANTVPQMAEAVAQATQAEFQTAAEAAALTDDVAAVLAAEAAAEAAAIAEAPMDLEGGAAATPYVISSGGGVAAGVEKSRPKQQHANGTEGGDQ